MSVYASTLVLADPKSRVLAKFDQALVGDIFGADALGDRDDLELLSCCADHIPNRLAHQKPRHRGYEGYRTGLGVRFVLSHDAIGLHASVVAPEGDRAAKGDSVR